MRAFLNSRQGDEPPRAHVRIFTDEGDSLEQQTFRGREEPSAFLRVSPMSSFPEAPHAHSCFCVQSAGTVRVHRLQKMPRVLAGGGGRGHSALVSPRN